MESRIFIRHANELIEEIGKFKNADLSHEEEIAQGTALQKDITAAFTGLQNPTLSTAEKLLDVALDAGFSVSPQVQHRIRSAMSVWVQG